MSGLLRPVGPEPAQTYWARRALLVAASMVLAVFVVLIIGGTRSGSAAQPHLRTASYPAPDSAAPSPAYPSSASPSPLEIAQPTPSFVDLSASATSALPATKSIEPRESTQVKTSRTECAPDELRPTLTGKQRLAPKQHTTFQLSLINGSDRTCIARVTRRNFELKISSVSDRIWSSDDCPSVIKPISRELGSEYAVAWTLSWDGKRSKSNCRSAREVPRPGRYVITAQFDGAEPVKLRMILSHKS